MKSKPLLACLAVKPSLLSAVMLLSACAGSRAVVAPGPAEAPAVEAAPAQAKSAGGLALPFIHDDYARAVAEAKQRELPLFVDVWTTW